MRSLVKSEREKNRYYARKIERPEEYARYIKRATERAQKRRARLYGRKA